MATEALKIAAITNLDASPPVRTTNYGARMQNAFGTVLATNGTGTATGGSTYRLARLPSQATLQSLKLWLDAAVTTFTADVTLYYSDTSLDGTDANSGLVTAHVFTTATAFAAITTATEYFLGGNIKGANVWAATPTAGTYGDPLWKLADLAADPGGFFDITLVTTTTTSGAPQINCSAIWANN